MDFWITIKELSIKNCCMNLQLLWVLHVFTEYTIDPHNLVIQLNQLKILAHLPTTDFDCVLYRVRVSHW
jgi:hypothetical protein